jgi:hypothetical protein
MNQNQFENIQETLEDFRALLPRYRSVKKDSNLMKKFCSRNRNPMWDVSNTKFFDTGLRSTLVSNQTKNVKDHFIQRSKAVKFVFDELDKNPNITTAEFINLLKKFCSVVSITEDEHKKVTQFAKKNPEYLNYETYVACGIKINGLSELMLA